MPQSNLAAAYQTVQPVNTASPINRNVTQKASLLMATKGRRKLASHIVSPKAKKSSLITPSGPELSKFCTSCGKKFLLDTYRFCGDCG